MYTYSSETRINVYPFTRQPSGDEIIIGRPDLSIFLALHRDYVEILDDFSAGRTFGEAEKLYYDRHAEIPDLADFLEILRTKHFVRPISSDALPAARPAEEKPSPPTAFSKASDFAARVLFSRIATSLWIMLVLAALVALALVPELIPKRTALFFPRHMFFFGISLLSFSLATALLHELAHWLAARAEGVPARIGFSHRLWILVAETDITGIWALPKAKRLLPILAGPLIDATSASVIVLFLFAARRPWRTEHDLAVSVLEGLILSYILRLLWQCYLFVRTDFYYAAVMLLDCKDLMRDTTNFLKNRTRQIFRLEPKVDQSHIPAKERRMIRLYAVPFVLGRCLAFGVLFVIQLPTLGAYFNQIAKNLAAGHQAGFGEFVESLLLGGIGVFSFLLGMYLWIKSLVSRRRPSNELQELPI